MAGLSSPLRSLSRRISTRRLYWDYFQTYFQRDLRELMEIRHKDPFERFVRLAAGRVGQPLNISALGSDAGVAAPLLPPPRIGWRS